MKKLLISIAVFILITPLAKAEIGLNAGLGLPFVSQYGVNLTMGSNLTFSATYNVIDISSDDASVKLSMPEATIMWHPFSGSFFIGAGVGQEKLEVAATEEISNTTVSAKVTAMTTIAKLGWMWGKGDGGLWFGMDLAYIIPSGGDVEINAAGLPTTSKEYKDVEDAANQFGETAYINITFTRLGYLF
jgi:hypothetical protein